jgi:hypothetical protein
MMTITSPITKSRKNPLGKRSGPSVLQNNETPSSQKITQKSHRTGYS